jgi:cholesterol oxidase
MSALHFTEVMRGVLAPRATSFARGRETGTIPLTLALTVRIADLDRFLADPEHRADPQGYVDCPLVGGRRAVLAGEVRLLAPTGDRDRRVMAYRLVVEDPARRRWTVSGVKEVQDRLGLDLWRDTTTLETNLFRGAVTATQEARAPLVATGVVRLSLGALLRQLTTFRTDAPSTVRGAGTVLRFLGFFLGTLAGVHLLWRRRGPLQHPARTIPLHAVSGVPGVVPETHYAETADGLTLTLLRFRAPGAGEAPVTDVVLCLPGLTASSDMYIMPEHHNLVRTLHAAGFGDVFLLDGRISARHVHNLHRHDWSVDDVALFDNPAALAAVRRAVGPEARVHVVAHCLGALGFAMSLAAGVVPGVRSAILNGVALTPRVSRLAGWMLRLAPRVADAVLGVDYINPRWGEARAGGVPRLVARLVSWLHPECRVPACHLTSFLWGFDRPVLFRHDTLDPVTHARIGDLFGGSSLGYHRHIDQMVRGGERAQKRRPHHPRHAPLPDDYLAAAGDIATPLLLVTGQRNALFLDANVRGFEALEAVAPGRHRLRVIPGYGHADVFIGRDVARDTLPPMVRFLRRHARPAGASP